MKITIIIRALIEIQKLIILVSIAISGNSVPASSQYWNMVGNLPYGFRYDDICFVDSLTGWTVNAGGSIYKTMNGGTSWSKVYDSNFYFRSVDFIDENIGFVGSLNSAFLRTDDGGETWEEIQNLIPGKTKGICGISHIGDKVYAVGIWSYPAYFIQSGDQGITWSYTDLSEYADGLVDCYFLNEDVGFVAGTKGGGVILKTSDGGHSWQEVHRTGTSPEYVWKLFFVNDSIAYASIESWAGPTSILKSTDGGNSWVEIEVSAGNWDIQGIGFIDNQTGWVSTRSDGSYSTYDGGQSWEGSTSLSGINRFIKLNDHLMYASGYRIFKYDDQLLGRLSGGSSQEHAILKPVPNPFSKELTIEIQLDYRTYAKLDLIALDGGHVVSLHDGYLHQGRHSFHLSEKDLHQVAMGLNIVYLRTNERFLTKEIIRVY